MARARSSRAAHNAVGLKHAVGLKPLARAGSANASAIAALPRCPPHLDTVARKEWRRIAAPLHDIGVLTLADRAALAAYCQAWSRWVEAEEKLQNGPALIKTPSGYAQQSPWLTIANKQLELMARYMSELGLTPSARARLQLPASGDTDSMVFKVVYEWGDGTTRDKDGNEVDEDGPAFLIPKDL